MLDAGYKVNVVPGTATARVDGRLQSEPVISVRSECDDVTRFPDRPKQIAAENFHRYTARKTGEVELGRLRETRKIYHHYNDLIFPTAKERQHFRIVRI